MNQKQLEKMKNGKGFIAALDQSGGSTPKALRLYGVAESAYSNDEEMFNLVHWQPFYLKIQWTVKLKISLRPIICGT